MSEQTLYIPNREEWRKWLEMNHDSKALVWLIYYKKHTGKPSIHYDYAVEEALCFGWIDSLVRRIDEERYMQKYTPRKPKSTWSKHNVRRVEKMIELGKMAPEGMKLYQYAIDNCLLPEPEKKQAETYCSLKCRTISQRRWLPILKPEKPLILLPLPISCNILAGSWKPKRKKHEKKD